MSPFQELASPRKPRRYPAIATDTLRMSKYVGVSDAHPVGVRITIGTDLAVGARMVIGFRADVYVDPKDRTAMIKVAKEGRWMICPITGTVTDHAGEVVRCVLKGQIRQDLAGLVFPNGEQSYLAANIVVRDEGILFDLARPVESKALALHD